MIQGTVIDGVVQFDTPLTVTDGTRVVVTLMPQYVYPHPLAPYDAELEGDLIRERIKAVEDGQELIPLDEAMAEMTQRLYADTADG